MTNFTIDSPHLIIASPYHSGSHAAWANGYRISSQHQVAMLTLPGRFWKWRMHGGAVSLANQLRQKGWRPRHILATDMLDLSTFAGLLRHDLAETQLTLYMHENQLTYPLPADPAKGPMRRQHGERDLHYVFINFSSQLVADRILFNSAYHRDSWFAALRTFLRSHPDRRLGHQVDALIAKSDVLPVGLNGAWLDEAAAEPEPDQPPLILWNQRWEYDKNPAAFFAALGRAKAAGLPFRLAVCGENFSRQPEVFAEELPRFRAELIHEGYADADTYRRLLWQSDIVISTADHEFFGISILEAIRCVTYPILPARLSYPELMPPDLATAILYHDEAELDQLLQTALQQPARRRQLAQAAAAHARRYDWAAVAPRYDAYFA
ncbi:MAG: DUF3524 domain-containing protein [Ardenticatenales bacterium]|nr:DUF3524 domain-containing protein [Ardenticatenales bacterium]